MRPASTVRVWSCRLTAAECSEVRFPTPVFNVLQWLERHAGPISEVSRRHRSAILFWSAIAIFVDHGTTVTFGQASLAGLGITVSPPQTLPIGMLITLMLLYRLAALWFTAFSDAGSDTNKAHYNASFKYDPDSLTPAGPAFRPDEVADEAAENRMYLWSVWRTAWDLVLPTVLGVIVVARNFLQGA